MENMCNFLADIQTCLTAAARKKTLCKEQLAKSGKF